MSLSHSCSGWGDLGPHRILGIPAQGGGGWARKRGHCSKRGDIWVLFEVGVTNTCLLGRKVRFFQAEEQPMAEASVVAGA